jgi:hypothetical protein
MTKIAGSGSRIRSEAWIRGSGSTPKCHGSATLLCFVAGVHSVRSVGGHLHQGEARPGIGGLSSLHLKNSATGTQNCVVVLPIHVEVLNLFIKYT